MLEPWLVRVLPEYKIVRSWLLVTPRPRTLSPFSPFAFRNQHPLSNITMTAVQEVLAAAGPIDYAAIVTAWSPEERAIREKKFLKKIDFRLLPILVSKRNPLGHLPSSIV